MSRCHQELCLYWTGQGCACDVLGIQPEAVDADTSPDVLGLDALGWDGDEESEP